MRPNNNQTVRYQGPTWYRTIASITNVPCQDGKLRTAYTVNGEPDTYFSIPAYIYFWDRTSRRNVKITGSLYSDESGYTFHAYYYNKNAHYLIPVSELIRVYDSRDEYARDWRYNPHELAQSPEN